MEIGTLLWIRSSFLGCCLADIMHSLSIFEGQGKMQEWKKERNVRNRKKIKIKKENKKMSIYVDSQKDPIFPYGGECNDFRWHRDACFSFTYIFILMIIR